VNIITILPKLSVIAWREDRRRFSVSLLLMLLQAAAAPLAAFAAGAVIDRAVSGDAWGASLAGVGVAWCVIASLTAGHFAHIHYFELGDMLLLRLQLRLAELANGSAGLEHHERADYADKLHVLREELGRAGSSIVPSSLGGLGLALAISLTAVMLGRLDPWLLSLPLAAIPPLLLGRRAEALLSESREASASAGRLARHLLTLATDASSSKELRVCNLQAEIRRRQSLAWSEASDVWWRAELRAAGLRVGGQLFFGLAYVGGTLLVLRSALLGERSVGDVVLVIAVAAQVNQQVSAAVNLHHELQRIAKTLADLWWMERAVSPCAQGEPDREPPARLTTGISLESVTFEYPGSQRTVLADVSVRLRAGSTVAIVGENGAGKTTLVKLLCGFYRPSRGAIRVDGVELRRFPIVAWRERLAAGFQDFVKFEFRVRETVGVGHLPEIESAQAVRAALCRARSDDVLAGMANGLETELGKSNPTGTELSIGQWQRLAIGRAMMRQEPILLLLDEPTSALDAQAEHALFERYVEAARSVREKTGAITLLVSHRFSTVTMADQILVVADRRVVEAGSHDELMKKGALYAELYGLQAKAYQ
jgi:ATP-binding cassette, subfamily B, bacterial